MTSRTFLLTLLVVLVLACTSSSVLAKKPPPPPSVAPADNLMVRLNRFMASSISLPFSTPFGRINALSMIAMHDAINTIQEIYEPVYQQDRLRGHDKNANYRAAMLGAFNETRHYGLNHIPDPYDATILVPVTSVALQMQQLATLIADELAALQASGVDQDDIDAGFKVGTRVGARVNALRENDGYRTFVAPLDPPCDVKGQWCSYTELSKPAGRRGFTYSNYAFTQPISYRSPEDLMCPPPLEIDSNLWRSSVNTTFMFGYKGSPQTAKSFVDEVQIWATGPSIQLMGYFMDEFYKVSQLTHTEYDSVAMFASLYVLNMDAGIHLNYNKIHYKLWRPWQVYKYLHPEATYETFQSNVDVHKNPEYPCGQCEGTTVSAKAISLFLGYDEFPFPEGVKMIVPGTNAQPEYHSFSQLSEAVARGRIFGGVHWPFSTQIGVLYGTKIAVENKLFKKAD